MKLPQGWKLIDRMEVAPGDTIHTMAMEIPGPAVILCRSRTKLDTDRKAMPAVSEALVVLPDMALESFDYGNEWRLVSAKPIEYAGGSLRLYPEEKVLDQRRRPMTAGQVIGSCSGAPQAKEASGMPDLRDEGPNEVRFFPEDLKMDGGAPVDMDGQAALLDGDTPLNLTGIDILPTPEEAMAMPEAALPGQQQAIRDPAREALLAKARTIPGEPSENRYGWKEAQTPAAPPDSISPGTNELFPLPNRKEGEQK